MLLDVTGEMLASGKLTANNLGTGLGLQVGDGTNVAHYASFRATGSSGSRIGYDGGQAFFLNQEHLKGMRFAVDAGTIGLGKQML